MNEEAKELNLKKSHFTVAHGMHHDQNYSSAYDIGKLCCIMMKYAALQGWTHIDISYVIYYITIL